MIAPSPYTEQELLYRLADGDQAAFEHFYRQYWHRVYGLAAAYLKSEALARDIVQDVFTHIWSKRELARGIEHFEAYITVVCRHMVLREINRADKRAGLHAKGGAATVYPDTLPDEALEVRELVHRVEALISKLPAQQQKVFQLSRQQGLSHAEIAGQLGITKETVKNHLVRALATLRSQLGDHPKTIILLLLAETFGQRL